MQIGAVMFFTEYSMGPAPLGRELERRGFESLWVPEHSHIPLSRKTPFPAGGDLPRPYYDILDPFVALTAAAAATHTLKLGTGVCLVNQRDPIQTAKLVASIDQISAGRFLFGIGNGWIPRADRIAELGAVLARFRQMATEAGRDPADLPITLFRVPEDADYLRGCRDLGVSRVVFGLPAAEHDALRPIMDRWAALQRQLAAG